MNSNNTIGKKRLLALAAAGAFLGLTSASPVMAQGNNAPSGGTSATGSTDNGSGNSTDGRNDHTPNYGWLGLLGLAGLAGLRKQPVAVRRDTEYGTVAH